MIFLSRTFVALIICQHCWAATVTNIEPISTRSDKIIIIIVDFDAPIKTPSDNAGRYELVSSSGEKVPASTVVASKAKIRFVFNINSGNFVIFERLVKDSSGNYLNNNEAIEIGDSSIEIGALAIMSRDKIPTINEENWKQYILDEYASNYLFPHTFEIGTNLGFEDSTKTVYHLELAQSDNYVHFEDWFIFWGLRGRWSTGNNDRLNYAQIYPLVLYHSYTAVRMALSTSLETGYVGFGKEGRGVLKGEFQFRLPYNPIDFTFGNPRWRINPVVNISLQGNIAWANIELPDSVKHSGDFVVKIRYDIPVGKTYYLQTNASGDYSTTTRSVEYSYELSFGYIADGTIRIAAKYKQGNQLVTYQFDRQLLFGFAVDVLNESAVK